MAIISNTKYIRLKSNLPKATVPEVVRLTDAATRELDEIRAAIQRIIVDDVSTTITGPGASTDNAIVRWDGVTGMAVQDSNAYVDDAGRMSCSGATISGDLLVQGANAALQVLGHSILGETTATDIVVSRHKVLILSEDESDGAPAEAGAVGGLLNMLYLVPGLDADRAGYDFASAEYNVLFSTGFDSTDGLGSNVTITNIRGQYVQMAGTPGTLKTFTISNLIGYEVTLVPTLDVGMTITNVVGFKTGNMAVSPTPTRGYGILASGPTATTTWAGMFTNRVQITSTNSLLFGGTQTTLGINSLQRGSTTTNITMTLNSVVEYDWRQASFAPVGGSTAKSLGLSGTQGWSGLYLDDTANPNTLLIQNTSAATPGNVSLTLNMTGANRVLTLGGNVILPSGTAYTPTNVTADRAYDANATTVAELADVLGTLIADLQTAGVIT